MRRCQRKLPLQFHVGFRDRELDLDLHKTNPLQLLAFSGPPKSGTHPSCCSTGIRSSVKPAIWPTPPIRLTRCGPRRELHRGTEPGPALPYPPTRDPEQAGIAQMYEKKSSPSGSMQNVYSPTKGASMPLEALKDSPTDFDFIIGNWTVRHERLNQLFSACTQWT